MKTLSTQAGDLPLIPEWSLPYTGTPGSGYSGTAGLHRHRRHDRVPLAHRPDAARLPVGHAQFAGVADVVVKFGGVVVKGANYAHYKVIVDR